MIGAAEIPAKPRSGGSILGRVSTALYLHPRLLLFLLLTPPMLWLGVIYLGSLFSLLLQSFFYIDGFTGLSREHLADRIDEYRLSMSVAVTYVHKKAPHEILRWTNRKKMSKHTPSMLMTIMPTRTRSARRISMPFEIR